MGKRRKIASLRDQDRRKTVKLANATADCFFLLVDGSLLEEDWWHYFKG
ncbi:hypothetical protein V3C99_003611 [Haemonchus contortus]